MLANLIIDHHHLLAQIADLAANDNTRVDPTGEAPPGANRFIKILSWIVWAAVIATIGAFIVAAAMLGYQRWSGGGGDAQGKLVGAMGGAALIAAAGTIINTIVFDIE